MRCSPGAPPPVSTEAVTTLAVTTTSLRPYNQVSVLNAGSPTHEGVLEGTYQSCRNIVQLYLTRLTNVLRSECDVELNVRNCSFV